MIQVEVWHGDIAEADVDVLVNASNTLLQLGTGVSNAIRKSCGARYQKSLHELLEESSPGGLEPGDVIVTHAGDHPRAKHVAHVAVMDYREHTGAVPDPDLARLERGTKLLWQKLAQMEHPVSVGMVALGAGTGGIGLRSSVDIACRNLKSQIESAQGTLQKVVFVSYEFFEHVNTAAVVTKYFDADLDSMSEEAQRMMTLMEADP